MVRTSSSPELTRAKFFFRPNIAFDDRCSVHSTCLFYGTILFKRKPLASYGRMPLSRSNGGGQNRRYLSQPRNTNCEAFLSPIHCVLRRIMSYSWNSKTGQVFIFVYCTFRSGLPVAFCLWRILFDVAPAYWSLFINTHGCVKRARTAVMIQQLLSRTKITVMTVYRDYCASSLFVKPQNLQ
jgi:hypothetical protein